MKINMTISLSKWPYNFSKWPYDEFGVPYDSFMVTPHPQCSWWIWCILLLCFFVLEDEDSPANIFYCCGELFALLCLRNIDLAFLIQRWILIMLHFSMDSTCLPNHVCLLFGRRCDCLMYLWASSSSDLFDMFFSPSFVGCCVKVIRRLNQNCGWNRFPSLFCL